MKGQEIAGRYTIEAELGAGGMGTVYKATDNRTSETVAIKQLKSQVAQPEIIERFQREGQVLRELNHPNIVKMLDAVKEEDSYYLVLEYVSGGDLKSLIEQNGKFDYQSCVDMAIDLADALTRAHRLQIIHRDLKPANILIGEDAVLRLADFGVAYLIGKERVTEIDAIIGTVDYLPPEAFDGKPADPAGDIWAFGILLFEMLTGRRPFASDTITATISAILNAPLPDLEAMAPDTPPALIDLIYRMLERDPYSRISSVRYVGAELEDILHGRDSAPPPSRFEIPVSEVLSRHGHNLPAQTTPFVGREHELVELERLIHDSDSRLITLQAPGGMGKTRLALEMASRLIAKAQNSSLTQYPFADSVYLVELAPLSDPERIVSVIANALGYQFQTDGREARQQILDYLREKYLLLIMDNFEHIMVGASLVSDILHNAPNVQIVITSRQRLNQSGETVFNLSGMDFPQWETPNDALEYAAVKLFMQSAKRVQPQFELTESNMDYVARICKLVHGMPLGIVLAASWLGMLTVEEIAAEIGKDIDFLTGEMSDLPERQRSMRAVFDSTWNLMTRAEQQVLMKLSIFRDGFSREAAQKVTSASLQILMSLMNKSVIQRNSNTGRFSIHELMLQYAEQRLIESDEGDATNDAYVAYFATYLKDRYIDLQGRRQYAATEEIQAEINNIRQAWQMAVDRRDTAHLATMALTWTMYLGVGIHVAQDLPMLKQAVDTLPPDTPEWDWIACIYEMSSTAVSTITPKYQVSEQILQRARQSQNRQLLMLSLEARGMILLMAGDPSGMALLEEGIALATEPEDTFFRVRYGTMSLGSALLMMGQPQAAYERLKLSVDEFLHTGDVFGATLISLDTLPQTTLALNRPDEALMHVERALDVSPSPSSRLLLRWAKCFYDGYLAFLKGEFDRIQTLYSEWHGSDFRGLAMWEVSLGFLPLIPEALGGDATRMMAHIARFEKLTQFSNGTRIWGYWLATLSGCAGSNFRDARNALSKMRQLEQISGYVAPQYPILATIILALEARQQDTLQHSVELLSLAFENSGKALGMYTNWIFLTMVRSELQDTLGNEAYNAAWKRGKSIDLGTVVREILTPGEEGH